MKSVWLSVTVSPCNFAHVCDLRSPSKIDHRLSVVEEGQSICTCRNDQQRPDEMIWIFYLMTGRLLIIGRQCERHIPFFPLFEPTAAKPLDEV